MKRLLIVEDNVSLARGMKLLLKDEGFTARIAHGGTEVQEIITGRYTPEFAILDLAMADSTGTELLAFLVNRWPKLKIYIYSGYVSDSKGLSRNVCGCFRKAKHSVLDIVKVMNKPSKEGNFQR